MSTSIVNWDDYPLASDDLDLDDINLKQVDNAKHLGFELALLTSTS